MKLRCYVKTIDSTQTWIDVECPAGVTSEQAIELAEAGKLDCDSYTVLHVPRVYLVCRHLGAIEWAGNQGVHITHTVNHVDDNFIASLNAGDIVLGILPIELAARVCEAGCHFYNLNIKIPFELRGKELTAQQMEDCGASFQEFFIQAF